VACGEENSSYVTDFTAGWSFGEQQPQATLLASSAAYPLQAFRYGNEAYGLQFHVEPDKVTWSAWREHLPIGLLEGTDLKQQLIEQVARALIPSFFEISAPRYHASVGQSDLTIRK
jgi:GMP synthase-like glutamine amidotransferase